MAVILTSDTMTIDAAAVELAARDLGLLGADKPEAAVEEEPAASTDVLADATDDDEPEIPPSRLKAHIAELDRELNDQRALHGPLRKARADRGEDEFCNSEAYGLTVRRIDANGNLEEVAGDRKVKARAAYFGAETEDLMNHDVPKGAHSSGGGRKTADPKVEKLRRERGRPREDDEQVKTERLSARVTPQAKQTLLSGGMSGTKAVRLAVKALSAGITGAELEVAVDDLAARKSGRNNVQQNFPDRQEGDVAAGAA